LNYMNNRRKKKEVKVGYYTKFLKKNCDFYFFLLSIGTSF